MKEKILLATGATGLGYLFLATRKRPMIKPPRYTCIQVFSYNECGVIDRCLETMLTQDILKQYRDRFKLQVFDGGSTDCTVDVARRYGFKVYVLGRGKLRARNYSVVNFPECKIHVHVDADTYFPSWWLRNVLYHFKDRDVVAVTTPRLYDNVFIAYIMIPFRGFVNLDERIYGSNSAIRHDVFIKNLFNEEYDGREDMVVEEEVEFYKRLSKYGRIVYEPTPAFTRVFTKKYVMT